MKVYVTEMLRWGDPECNSYVIGVYSTKHEAKLAGDIEVTWRGGKYKARINEFEMDKPQAEKKQRLHRATQERINDRLCKQSKTL